MQIQFVINLDQLSSELAPLLAERLNKAVSANKSEPEPTASPPTAPAEPAPAVSPPTAPAEPAPTARSGYSIVSEMLNDPRFEYRTIISLCEKSGLSRNELFEFLDGYTHEIKTRRRDGEVLIGW